jgi:hypothetical protein
MLNLIGQKFGRLIVIQRMNNDKHKKTQWLCKCNCGKETIIIGSHLKSENTRGCGCLKKEMITQRSTIHGHAKSNKKSYIYKTWIHMIQRCTNPNDKKYPIYGNRGITICKRWMKFLNFLKDMSEPPTNKHSIDRINNNGNYCKSNCRWATRKEQARNTRKNRLISFNGKIQCMSAWAEELYIDKSTLWSRLNSGWSIEKALTTPIKKCKKELL